jgi:hypothetical protein
MGILITSPENMFRNHVHIFQASVNSAGSTMNRLHIPVAGKEVAFLGLFCRCLFSGSGLQAQQRPPSRLQAAPTGAKPCVFNEYQ